MSDCIFCKIVSGGVPADIVYQDEQTVAFKDVQPQAPEHYLIVPRKHFSGLNDMSDEQQLLGRLFQVAIQLAKDFQLDSKGYRLVANCGSDGGQTVDHVHIHLLGGRNMTWPPG